MPGNIKSRYSYTGYPYRVAVKKGFATYMMGMGRIGGYTPKNHLSRWLETEDSFWIGETTGGIQCELRGGSYRGPMRTLYQPNPSPSWYNGMNAGFRIDSKKFKLKIVQVLSS